MKYLTTTNCYNTLKLF